MKAAVFHEHGGTGNVRYEDFPDPVCRPGDCLVRVGATCLNGFEPMILQKTTALRTPLPMIPGGDAAGEVLEVGAEARSLWQVGDRVSLYPMVAGEGMTGETRLGAACELIRAPAGNLVRLPDGLGFESAASLPIAYGTALRMMTSRGRVEAGERVLILGATGGVGTACVQLAKAAGAEVIACGSAAWKLERLEALGADHTINTATEDLRQAVWDRLGKPSTRGGGRDGNQGGVDVVVNFIGGETWIDCLKSLRVDGRMLVCGASAGYEVMADARYVWSFEQMIIGSNGWTLEDHRTLLAMAADGRITPVIHGVRPISQTGPAIQDLIDRKVFGKLVLVP